MEFWTAHYDAHRTAWEQLGSAVFRDLHSAMLDDWVKTLEQDGTLYFIGNGGSSVDACHIAAELIGRYERERRPLKAVSLTSNLATITAIGNDYSFDQVFTRSCEALLGPKDLLVAISTSGNSANVLKACEVARAKGALIHGWTGQSGGKLKALADRCLCVPSTKTSVIQESYLAWGHALCAGIDARFS